MQEMKLQDLKTKSPTELLSFAEEVAVENASAMRKQELMFAILKQLAARDVEITGTGVVEVLQDGFGFLRSPDSNYLAGPDDIYVAPEPDPPLRPCAPATRSKARSGARKRASAISPCSRSTPSISRTRRSSATRSISTI